MLEYSIYTATVDTKYKNTTKENLELISNLSKDEYETFSFAVIADSHLNFDELEQIISDINKNHDIKFVLHAGDFTNEGLLKEYEFFYKYMDKLNRPYFTVIGNHDYKSNGKEIYKQMFGELNYTFEFNDCTFIMFDDIFWESNKNPDFDWLEAELQNSIDDKTFIVTHIPNFTDQYPNEMHIKYKNMLYENNVSLSIHGHTHIYYYADKYNNGVKYLVVPQTRFMQYCIINVKNHSIEVELIEVN